MLVKIVLIFLLGVSTASFAADNCNQAEQETLRLRIKELELRKQVLELESQKTQQQAQPQEQPSQQPQYVAPSRSSTSGGNGYTRGPRGGCYTFSSSGKKRYVDRRMCD
jgi:hypothetical protein